MRGQDLHHIDGTETGYGNLIPEAVVAAGPYDPSVAAFYFFRREGDPAIHVVKVIFIPGGEGIDCTSCQPSFVQYCAGLRAGFLTAGKQHDYKATGCTHNPAFHGPLPQLMLATLTHCR